MHDYQNLDTIWQQISHHHSIAIFRHVNPDPDAYGSQFALAKMIKDNFPEKQIYCYGESVDRLAYLYADCQIFYQQLPTELPAQTLIITVDTANQERIDTGDLTGVQVDIKIDHHPGVDAYANMEYVNQNTPATCAILLDYFLHLQKTQENIIITTSVYEKLYAGIVGDTGNFAYGTGLNQTFFANVGVIFEHIDTKKSLARFFQKTLAEVKFKGYLATCIEIDAALATVSFTSDTVENYGVSIDFATSLVNIMSEIEHVEIWASFCEDKTNHVIRCSLRSRYLDISKLAQTFGGGGHPNASGVRVKTWAEVAKIKEALKKLL